MNPARYLNQLAALVAVLLCAFVLLFGTTAWLSEKEDQIGEMRTALELSEKALDRYFLQSEAALSALALDIQAAGGFDDAATARSLLHRYVDLHPEVSVAHLIRPDGQFVATSAHAGLPGLPGTAQEPSFGDFLRESRQSERMVLSRPLVSRITRQWVFPMNRAVLDDDGRIAAVVTSALPVDLLQNFWRDAPVVGRASIGLLRDDGYLLSRYPAPEARDPSDVYGSKRVGPLTRHLETHGFPREGLVEGISQLSGVSTVVVFRRLEHFPVTIFVAMPASAFYGAWWRRVQVPFALVALLGVIGVFGHRLASAHQRRSEAERQRAEAQLRISEAEHRFLIDRLPAGVVVHGPDGTVLRCNPRAQQLLGRDAAPEVPGRLFGPQWQLLRSDGSTMPAGELPVEQAIRTRRPVPELVVGVRRPAAAETVWLMASATPEFDVRGALCRVILSFIDVTARRDAQKTLERSESRYRLLYENSLDGVILSRDDGTVIGANAAAQALFRCDEESLIRRRCAVTDTEDERLPALLAARAAHGHARGELTLRRADGSSFEAEVSTTLQQDAAGEQLASFCVRDVTDRSRVAGALAAQQAAESANRAKTQFVARMSHELRTPLNAILGFSEVLQIDRMQPLTDAQAERIGHIHRAGRHLLSMIEDLLDLSHIESGALRLSMAAVDPLEIARQALLDVAVQATAMQVEVQLHAPSRPIGRVDSDATRLRQIILNLLSNGIKYNRRGGRVTLDLRKEGDTLALSVSDTGIGMSSAQIDALFQPFNRLGRERGPVDGTGIGLVITKSLIEAMGGRLHVASRSGAGSEFRVELPTPAAGPAAAAGMPPAPAASASIHVPPAVRPPAVPSLALKLAQAARADTSEADEARLRVLYIDDCPVNRALVEAVLRMRPGVHVSLAGGGPEGVALARSVRPDIVLTDMMMPAMNGAEVLQAIQQDETLRTIPCIAVSASAMPEEVSGALAAGFDGYLTKPIAAPLLFREIDRALDAVRSAAVH